MQGLDPSQDIPRPIPFLVTAIIVGCATLSVALSAPTTIKQFLELFSGVGADLSSATRLVLRLPYLWWLFALPGVALAIWVSVRARVTPAEYRRMKTALRLLTLLFGLAIGFAVYVLYVPLFKLGAAV
jgi:hypothetical protein